MIAALLTACIASAASPAIRPDPQGWSDLRWGMTYQQVERVLRARGNRASVGELKRQPQVESPRSFKYVVRYEELIGAPTTSLELEFFDGRLCGVAISFARATVDQQSSLRAGLERKYGPPTESHGPTGATWKLGGTSIILMILGDAPALGYISSEWHRTWEDRFESAEAPVPPSKL